MKLVVTFSHGDGCTYSCDETYPVEYESEEALAVDLEAFANSFIQRNWSEQFGDTELKGTNIPVDLLIEDDKYYAPNIYTLEAWWEENK